MMFFLCSKLPLKSLSVLILVLGFIVIPIEINAQAKKSATKPSAKDTAKKTTTAKKPETKSTAKKADVKDTKNSKSAAAAKNAKTTDKNAKDKNTKDKNAKNAKPTKAELAKQAEQRRAEAERKRVEEARRQAALAEKRRREQEARERALAFERGLKTETQENIKNDNLEGEDMEVRRAAISALGSRAGTIVVMEPQTGKILSIVNQEWAIRRGFKPCSTIKLVTGVAGVSEKLIDQTGNIANRRFQLDLNDALAHSNNSYFQVVGGNIGSEKMISYARALGLGEPTGINADNEFAGKLPYGNNNARIYSHGDDFEVTPLQLGVMVSSISNGGKIVVPQIAKTKNEKANFRGFMKREMTLPNEDLQKMLPGMLGAVNYGTAQRASDATLNIAGKTGSCIGQGSWVGLFASVAPVINPQFAVIVITRGQAERGKFASEIAGKIYKSLSPRFANNKELIAKVPLELKPQQKINAKNSAKLDNDAGEDSDEGDVKPASKNDTNKKSTVQNNQTNFETIVIPTNREQTRPRIVPSKP